jgi:hypothetical protein
MMVLEIFLAGMITAFGWWTSTHYIIEPYFPAPIERADIKKTIDASKD